MPVWQNTINDYEMSYDFMVEKWELKKRETKWYISFQIEKEFKRSHKLFMNCNFYNMFEIKRTYTSPKGQNRYEYTHMLTYDQVNKVLSRLVENKVFKESARYQRSIMTPSMRYDILKRDNFTCQICGATSKTGAKLHVDHINPISKGGKTKPSNLQTLCDMCNLGKGVK